MTRAKRIGVAVGLLGGFGLTGALIVYAVHREYIRGPTLVETPDEVSLVGVFPDARAPRDRLAQTLRYADDAGATAVVVLRSGGIVAEFGRTDLESSVHSVRKSLLSVLYGIAVDRGLVDIQQSLGELGIDDHEPPLSASERSATLRDLLAARSGIYHPSVKDDNGPYPAPGTHAPGEAFVYNNWSFNAAGGIFEQLVGLTLGQAFEEWVAEPLGMQDFEPEDVRYFEGRESVFPAWRFWMSTRDLARFGQMVLDGGVWRGHRVVSKEWIEASMTPYTELPNGVGYGYMWWLMPDSAWMATGTGGQKIRIYPATETVVVTKVNTGEGFTRTLWWALGPRMNNNDVGRLVELLGLRD